MADLVQAVATHNDCQYACGVAQRERERESGKREERNDIAIPKVLILQNNGTVLSFKSLRNEGSPGHLVNTRDPVNLLVRFSISIRAPY